MKDFIREKVCFYSPVYSDRFSELEMLEYASAHGAAGLELFNFSEELRTPDMKVAREIGKRAKELDLKLPCLSAGIDFTRDFDRTLELARGYVDICSELEIPLFHHTLVFAMRKEEVLPGSREKGLEAALSLAEYSARRGVKSIIEDQGFVYNGVEGYGALLEADPRIGVLLDVGNIYFVDETPVDFLDAYKGKINHVHIKDFAVGDTAPKNGEALYRSQSGKYINTVEIGTGSVDFLKIAEGLAASGYEGLYSIEGAALSGEDECERIFTRLYSWFGKK